MLFSTQGPWPLSETIIGTCIITITIYNKTTSCHWVLSSLNIWLQYSDMIVLLRLRERPGPGNKAGLTRRVGGRFPVSNMQVTYGFMDRKPELSRRGGLSLRGPSTRPRRVERRGNLAAWMRAQGWRGRDTSKLHVEVSYSIPFATLGHGVRPSLNAPAQS